MSWRLTQKRSEPVRLGGLDESALGQSSTVFRSFSLQIVDFPQLSGLGPGTETRQHGISKKYVGNHIDLSEVRDASGQSGALFMLWSRTFVFLASWARSAWQQQKSKRQSRFQILTSYLCSGKLADFQYKS